MENLKHRKNLILIPTEAPLKTGNPELDNNLVILNKLTDIMEEAQDAEVDEDNAFLRKNDASLTPNGQSNSKVRLFKYEQKRLKRAKELGSQEKNSFLFKFLRNLMNNP